MDMATAHRLRDAGLRATKPRLTVLAVLEDAGTRGEHPLVSEIVDRTRERLGDVSTQAVYDCLDALRQAGMVRRVEVARSAARYEARVGDNHHHLVCRTCGTTIDVDCTVGAAPCLQPSDSHGFVLDEAEVIFWGRCPSCVDADQPATSGTTERNERNP